MNTPEFIDLVAKMRAAQREYFRTRSHDALESSKNYERDVDAALRELRGGPGLFEEDRHE